jgi:lipoate-protein ligase B
MSELLKVVDAGVMAYRPAWDLQLQLHERVLAGEAGYAGGVLMLVEHPPVVTYGRRPEAQRHLLASPRMLEARGVEVMETDRGGDITFHGPGQLVVYPIINLNLYGLNLHAYMRFLEEAVIRALAGYGIEGERSEGATGVWVDETQNAKHKTQNDGAGLAKICAVGVKLKRWVTLHGIALNVATDLSFFEMINPCGLGRPVTSMRRLLGDSCPTMDEAKRGVVGAFNAELEKKLAK